jgi:protein TonB
MLKSLPVAGKQLAVDPPGGGDAASSPGGVGPDELPPEPEPELPPLEPLEPLEPPGSPDEPPEDESPPDDDPPEPLPPEEPPLVEGWVPPPLAPLEPPPSSFPLADPAAQCADSSETPSNPRSRTLRMTEAYFAPGPGTAWYFFGKVVAL